MKEKSLKLKFNNGAKAKELTLHFLNARQKSPQMLNKRFRLLQSWQPHRKRMKNCKKNLLKIILFKVFSNNC